MTLNKENATFMLRQFFFTSNLKTNSYKTSKEKMYMIIPRWSFCSFPCHFFTNYIIILIHVLLKALDSNEIGGTLVLTPHFIVNTDFSVFGEKYLYVYAAVSSVGM